MHAALMEQEITYYLKQWDYYLLLSQKSKCPSVPECVSVALCQLSLNLWLHAILLFDGLFGFIMSFKISKCGCDTDALRTLNFVTFDMPEYWWNKTLA